MALLFNSLKDASVVIVQNVQYYHQAIQLQNETQLKHSDMVGKTQNS